MLRGKRFFNTGLARWSLRARAGARARSCHTDGLTDNVTWYFARGPRQSTSLDGSFASKDPDDQRIFNWTAIFDEVDDFENNTRGVSGGVGAIVSGVSAPPQTGRSHRHRRPRTRGPQRLGGAGGGSGKSARARRPAEAERLGRSSEVHAEHALAARPVEPRGRRRLPQGQSSSIGRRAARAATAARSGRSRGASTRRASRTNAALATTRSRSRQAFPTRCCRLTIPANRMLRFAGGNVGGARSDPVRHPPGRHLQRRRTRRGHRRGAGRT